MKKIIYVLPNVEWERPSQVEMLRDKGCWIVLKCVCKFIGRTSTHILDVYVQHGLTKFTGWNGALYGFCKSSLYRGISLMLDYLAWWKKQVIWSQYKYQQQEYIPRVLIGLPVFLALMITNFCCIGRICQSLYKIIHATSITGLCRFLGLQVKFCKIIYFNATNELMKDGM